MTRERIIYFCEVISFFKKNLKQVAFAFLSVFVLTFLFLVVFVRPYYCAESTFKQAASRGEEGATLQTLLKSFQNSPEEASAICVMQSKKILSAAISEVGLQIAPKKDYAFSEIDYPGETVKEFSVRPLSETVYEVEGFGKGRVGQPFQIEGAKWTLTKMPESQKVVSFRLLPMRDVIPTSRKKLKIKSSRIDGNLLMLSYKHPDRRVAIHFLDTIMKHYRTYLANEHEELALAQITYLQNRREQLSREFDGALSEHVAFMENSSKGEGYIGLAQEVEMLSDPKERYAAKKHQLDLDLKKWRAPQLEARSHHPWKEGLEQRDVLEWKKHQLNPSFGVPEEFSGLDLEMAEALYNDYAKQREGLNSLVQKLERITQKIDEPDFEMTALGQILTDSVSQGIISKATQQAFDLSDQNNRSEKELKYIKEALNTQKAFLKNHIFEKKQLTCDELDLIETKLSGLRMAALDLLEMERKNVEHKLAEIGEKMQELPEKWRQESQLKLKKELTLQIIEGLSQLSESKVIHHHLFHIESKPLDPADAPLHPKSRYIFVLSVVGGLLGAFLFFLVWFVRGAIRGLPVSEDYLRDQGYEVIKQGESLERLALKIGADEVVALINFKREKDLLKLLEKMGYAVCLQPVPENIYSWEKPSGCVLLSGQKGAIRSAKIADRFVMGIKDERPQDLAIYPKASLLCVLNA